MSDVINGVLRDDLKSLLVAINGTMWSNAQWAVRLRALLSEQPQASAAQSQAGQEKVNAEPYFLDGRIKGYTIDKDEYLRVSREYAIAAQSASDEREAFEAWADREWPGAQRQQLARDEMGNYTNSIYRDFWTGWQARASWQRAQSAPVVPEGWRLVPVEPTEEMIDAGCREHTCVQGDSWYSDSEISEHDAIAVFKAMLAAASKVAPHG